MGNVVAEAFEVGIPGGGQGAGQGIRRNNRRERAKEIYRSMDQRRAICRTDTPGSCRRVAVQHGLWTGVTLPNGAVALHSCLFSVAARASVPENGYTVARRSTRTRKRSR